MAIDKVGPKLPVGTVSDNIKTRDRNAAKTDAKDEAVLSNEALQLFATEKMKRLETIRDRVKAGFYESREVTEKVVEGLIRDIRRPPAG